MLYLDSSAVIRWVTGSVSWPSLSALTDGISSEILRVECRRMFLRLRSLGEIDDAGLLDLSETFEALYGHIRVLELASSLLERAADSFPTIVGSLDAIHLSSALYLAETHPRKIQFVTDDRQLGMGARALGFGVVSSSLRSEK